MKKINVFCVLVLALMLVDFVVDFFLNTSNASVELKLENESFGFLLFAFIFSLVALGAVMVAIVSFVKFILNVNRNEVFSQRNISLLRKYGVCALVCGVCAIIVSVTIGIEPGVAVGDSLDALGEGFFALLMGEVFGIGLELQEGKRATA